MVGARTHLFGQRNTSMPRKPRKRSRGPNRRNTRLLQSHGLLLKVELLVLIFLHLFHFKDEWISKKRILNASGLRYYSLKLKVFSWLQSSPYSSTHLCVDFNCKYESILSTVSAEDKECILSADINCNYSVSSDCKEIKSILCSLGLKQLITSTARITPESKTLMDVTCSNEPHNINSVKVIPAGLSDRELIGCALELNNV